MSSLTPELVTPEGHAKAPGRARSPSSSPSARFLFFMINKFETAVATCFQRTILEINIQSLDFLGVIMLDSFFLARRAVV
ncbi:unnamed protein product [Tilletia caries]|nr:unnamed protein product [Tilletia caries]